MPAAASTFVTLGEAQRIVREHVRALPPRLLDWGQAAGRTLAEAVACDVDVPPFDRAVMDGYAVRAEDVALVPAKLRLVGQIQAGAANLPEVRLGEAVQINTGAPIPAGADCVIRVEDTKPNADGRDVEVQVSAAAGQHICRRGAYVRAGDAVLQAGDRFGPGERAIAATAGATRVRVFGAACVGLLVTGNELVAAEEKPARGQIRDSNGPMLAALMTADGAEVSDLGRVGDDRMALIETIRHGVDNDVLVLTGGVSMGAFDFVPDVLMACGVQIHFKKMRTQPGRPTLFGTTETGTLVFGLPGNPVSALVGYYMLVRPAIAQLHGRDVWPRRWRPAILEGTLKKTGERLSFWPAQVATGEDGRLFATPLTWYGSGDPFGLRGANGFIVRPPQSPAGGRGEVVEVAITQWHDAD